MSESESAVVRVQWEWEEVRDILAGVDIFSLPNDYTTPQMARDRMDRLQRLEVAMLQIYNETYDGDPVRAIAKTALGR